MGLIKNPGEDKYAVLSDILGDEDHLGDMDFKTTGTKDGLTATQMDIKCDGLSFEILEKALMQGYLPDEMPKLARVAHLYQQATNCSDEEAEAIKRLIDAHREV